MPLWQPLMSLWQPLVSPVTTKLASWQLLVFRCGPETNNCDSIQWYHMSISNHRQFNSRFISLFRLMTKKTSRLRITGPLYITAPHYWPFMSRTHQRPVNFHPNKRRVMPDVFLCHDVMSSLSEADWWCTQKLWYPCPYLQCYIKSVASGK